MTQNSVKKYILKHYELTHHGTIYNIVCKWFELYKENNQVEMGGSLSWKVLVKYINKDPQAFKEWVRNLTKKDISFHLEKQ